jgi:MYND finger
MLLHALDQPALRMQALHCCYHCGKLAERMPQCRKCQQARFWSPACQRMAWPSHKAKCREVSDFELGLKQMMIFWGHVLQARKLCCVTR